MMHLFNQRLTALCFALIVSALCWPDRCSAEQSKTAHELKVFHTRAVPAAILLIHGTADIAAMGPVIEAFQAEHPDIEIDYRLYETVPLYQEAIGDPDNKPFADLLISSAMDLQVKLANDGYVQHVSVATNLLPEWAVWRNEIFGFTLEPAVIVYNQDRLRPDEAPKSHQDLIRLLERSPERFRGKIATYDIGISGVGYLFATTEAKSWFRKSAQDDKWNFCLTAAIIAANRRYHEQTTAPEPHTGPSRRRWHWPPSRAIARSPNWPSISTFTLIRSRPGRRSSKERLLAFSGREARRRRSPPSMSNRCTPRSAS